MNLNFSESIKLQLKRKNVLKPIFSVNIWLLYIGIKISYLEAIYLETKVNTPEAIFFL